MSALLAAALSLVALSVQDTPDRLAIVDVTVIQPDSGTLSEHQTVVIAGSKIESVNPKLLPTGTQRVDGKGKFLIPGLWDMHVHWYDEKGLSLFTANGVTGVRVMFGSTLHLNWRKRIEAGTLVGPRLVIASPIVDGPKPVWPGSFAVSNPEQGREAVRKAKADGFDFIKVYSLLPRDGYLAIADESKKLKIPFAGHIPSSVPLLEAARSGQLSDEHLGGFLAASSTEGEKHQEEIDAAVLLGLADASKVLTPLSIKFRETYDPNLEAALLRNLAKTTMWQCPTLTVLRAMSHFIDPLFREDPRVKYMPPGMAKGWDPTADFRFKTRTEESWQRAKAEYAFNLKLIARLRNAKIPILAGTDCLNPFCFPGFSLHDELELLVEGGLTNQQALAAATSNPGKFLGETARTGRIAPGFDANVVLLSANPLEKIGNTRKIVAVVQAGKLFDRSALDAILAAAEKRSAGSSGGSAGVAGWLDPCCFGGF